MKKSMLSLLLSLFVVFAQGQERVFYYDESGEKIYLQKENYAKIIQFANEQSARSSRLFSELRSQNSGLLHFVRNDVLFNALRHCEGDSPKQSRKSY